MLWDNWLHAEGRNQLRPPAKQPLDSDDTLSLPLVDQCGTLLPFRGPSDAHMQLKIAQSRLAWEDGERVLAGFRDEFLV